MSTHTTVFARFRNRILRFSSVTVGVEEAAPGQKLSIDNEALRDDPNVDLEDRPEPKFIDAAIRGIQRTANALAMSDPTIGVGKTVLKEVLCRWPDTTEDAVECAAGMAFFRAIYPAEHDPDAEFTDCWRLRIWDVEESGPA
jgi:hypothetical protein